MLLKFIFFVVFVLWAFVSVTVWCSTNFYPYIYNQSRFWYHKVAILVSGWSIFKEICSWNCLACAKFPWAAIGSSCLWLANFKKSSLKPFGQINWNLVGSNYGRFCIKVPQNRKVSDSAHWASRFFFKENHWKPQNQYKSKFVGMFSI